MKKNIAWGVLALVFICTTTKAQLALDLEGNYVFSVPYNTVRIPSEGGTRIDINNDLNRKEEFTYRVRASYTINDRHVISALYAPLLIKSSGYFNQDVRYDDAVFTEDRRVTARYQFNSYRLTYRYMFVRRDDFKLGFGITGKIREANIVLSDGVQEADFPNVGFVPLINFYAEWRPGNKKFAGIIEGDALGTAQGRAEDIFAGIAYRATKCAQLKAGYRLLEGGADVEDNYNFAFINYVAAGAIITFNKSN